MSEVEKKNESDMPELLNEEAESDAPVMSEEEEAQLKKKNKKKKMIIGIAVFALVGVLSGLLLMLEPWAKQQIGESLGMYGSNKSYNHYDADYDLDVTTVEEYMQLDRNIYFMQNGEKYFLTESPEMTADKEFFINYFDCAINGRYTEYNGLFTDNYYKTEEPYIRFAPQMIYDITVEKLSENYKDGNTVYKYNVSYKIYRNNGTFRNDIGSDGSKTLMFTLIGDGTQVKIDAINYYYFN